MNRIKTALLIAGILVAGMAFNIVAATPAKSQAISAIDGASKAHDKNKHKNKHKGHKTKTHKYAAKQHKSIDKAKMGKSKLK